MVAVSVPLRRAPLRFIAVAAALLIGSISGAASASPDRMTGAEISILLRTTVVALDQANNTGNYSVLRDLGDTPFQTTYNQAALAEMFRAFREQHIDLGPVVLFDAQMDAAPQLTQDGVLRLTGHFPTSPEQVIFDITYRSDGGPWKIADINVGLRASPPEQDAAPSAPGVKSDPPMPVPRPLRRGSTAQLSNQATDGGI